MKPPTYIMRTAIKRKKRVDKGPFSLYWRDKSDVLFAKLIKKRAGNRCEKCGLRGRMEVHHLIKRNVMRTRCAVKNGICLCSLCHGSGIGAAHSTHGNELFLNWVKCSSFGRYQWVIDHQHDSGRVDWQETFEELRRLINE